MIIIVFIIMIINGERSQEEVQEFPVVFPFFCLKLRQFEKKLEKESQKVQYSV